MPRLSICIPTYNRASVLADRLKRMEAMQSNMEIEIAMSDNCSPDDTRDVAESFRKSFAGFRYTRQQSVISPVLNFYVALRNATFEYVIQIGDDDCVIESNMLKALAFFQSEPELQALIGNQERFNFLTGQSEGVVAHVSASERHNNQTASKLFAQHYFFEYLITKRETTQLHFHNEGLSYPLGWKLLHGCFREGTVALEPLALIYKDSNPARLGYRNFIIELQDFARADSEFYAALTLLGTPREERSAFYNAALMRSIRYSSDAGISARDQSKVLISLHYAQKASVYDYDTQHYPAEEPSTMLVNRLAHWLGAMANALGVDEVVLEEHTATNKLVQPLTALVKDCRVLRASVTSIRELSMGRKLCVTHEHDPVFAAFAALEPSIHYCALADLLHSSIDKPADYWVMKALLEAPSPT
jgi:glycosyltransferase involved in cell wall biosynthesis